MNKLLSHSSVLRENMFVLIGICFCIYFSYQTIQGDRSVLRYYKVSRQIEEIEVLNEKFDAESSALEKKIVMMRPGSVDKDLLEERVRSVLGYRERGEYIILSN